MKVIFSAVISTLLLFIYVYLIIEAIRMNQCMVNVPERCETSQFTDQMASTLALIGGLVAALVISELAVTPPGKVPAARMLSIENAENRKEIMQIVTGFYLFVWLIAGFSAFLFGYLLAPDDGISSLSDLGQSWLGIAVGAAYSYLGIK